MKLSPEAETRRVDGTLRIYPVSYRPVVGISSYLVCREVASSGCANSFSLDPRAVAGEVELLQARSQIPGWTRRRSKRLLPHLCCLELP
jgi:hypothetical protein